MLSKSAQSVQDSLFSQGIHAKVVELPASTRTAEEAAKAIGCQVAQIAKSLVFRTKHSNLSFGFICLRFRVFAAICNEIVP